MTVHVQAQRSTYVSPAAATSPAVTGTHLAATCSFAGHVGIVESETWQASYVMCEPGLQAPGGLGRGWPGRRNRGAPGPDPLLRPVALSATWTYELAAGPHDYWGSRGRGFKSRRPDKIDHPPLAEFALVAPADYATSAPEMDQ
jgi:hypothetical protein